MALIITTWLWGDKYPETYVRKLRNAVARNLKQPHRFWCITDRVGRPLDDIEWKLCNSPYYAVPGCFARLKLFDPQFQRFLGAVDGDRIVNIDLDAVVTGGLDELFDKPEPFVILQNINTTNPEPFNGSVWMLHAGYRPDVWADFSLDEYKRRNVPWHAIPDDQGWLHYKLSDAGSWGAQDGVYGFKKRGWPAGDALPVNARVIAFPGWRDPAKFEHLAWVKDHWR